MASDVATYIFGGNARRQRIAMTAPVHLWQDEEGGHLAFTMPAQHALDRLPDPLDDGIRIQSLDEHLVAVLPLLRLVTAPEGRPARGGIDGTGDRCGLFGDRTRTPRALRQSEHHALPAQ